MFSFNLWCIGSKLTKMVMISKIPMQLDTWIFLRLWCTNPVVWFTREANKLDACNVSLSSRHLSQSIHVFIQLFFSGYATEGTYNGDFKGIKVDSHFMAVHWCYRVEGLAQVGHSLLRNEWRRCCCRVTKTSQVVTTCRSSGARWQYRPAKWKNWWIMLNSLHTHAYTE